MGYLRMSRIIPAPRAKVFEYVQDFRNLPETLTGIFGVEFPSEPPLLEEDLEFEMTLSRFGVRSRIEMRVESISPGHRIELRQIGGFFRTWHHTVVFDDHGPERTLITDIVHFRLPLGILGFLADDLFVRKDIASIFEHRYTKMFEHFERVQARERQSEHGSGGQ